RRPSPGRGVCSASRASRSSLPRCSRAGPVRTCPSRTPSRRSRRSSKARPTRSRSRRSSLPARWTTSAPTLKGCRHDTTRAEDRACPTMRIGPRILMPIQLEIVTPERQFFSATVDSVQVPGSEGELGVLPHHAPLVSTLGVGELRFRKDGAEESFAIVGGFLQVRPDKVVVLAETADMASEIDLEKAQEARREAERALESGYREGVDL